MEQIVIYLSMVQKIVNLKQKILKLQQAYYAQEIFLKTGNMKKTGLTGYAYDFSADYSTVTVDDIKDIHHYLMKKIKV